MQRFGTTKSIGEIIDFIATTNSPLGEILSGGLRHNGDGTLATSEHGKPMQKAQKQIEELPPLTAEEQDQLRQELADDLALSHALWDDAPTGTESNVFDSSHCNGTKYQS